VVEPLLRNLAFGAPIASPSRSSRSPYLSWNSDRAHIAYLVEKRLAKKPEEFGNGAIEAVAGPEAANNASAAGVLAPLLSLGLPTSATAAIMLAAFQQYGLQPGPTLLTATRSWSGA
jgi:putative tricarboxylic transport membrane protein